MNSRQYNLTYPGAYQKLRFFHNLVNRFGTNISPGIRNDAVTAVPIAPVLNLDVGSGVTFGFNNISFFKRNFL